MRLMNQFEAAKLKAEKNAERRSSKYVVPAPSEPEPLVVAPKEKPKHAVFIKVTVQLPDRELSVCLTKPHVYQNISPNRLTKSEIKKCLEDGFRPLLGGLDDVN